MRISTGWRSADGVALLGGVVVAMASFAPQFRYRYVALSGGCSAWTACAGSPIGPSPDITNVMRWLCVTGIAVAIAPIAFAGGRLHRRFVQARLLSAWAVILGVVALLVFPTWQERWIGINEWNYQFVILPDWWLAGVLVGLMVVLTAAVKADVLRPKA